MSRILELLKCAPHVEPIKDPSKIKSLFRRLRFQNMTGMLIGYAIFYFVRKNFTIAMPGIFAETGYTKTDIGLALTLFSFVYGFGKFANGVLADRANARYFMALGLLCSGIVNIFFGLSTSLVLISAFMLMNAWFQSMGMPPSVRLLTHWFCPTELGTFWGIQSIAHQIGGAGIMLFGAYLAQHYGWRYAFYIPAFIAIGTAFLLVWLLRDTPQSVGLPPVEEFKGELKRNTDANEDSASSFKEILFGHVLKNRLVWIVACANIFVYIVRIGIMDWAPTFLVESRGASLAVAGFKTAGFEIAGIFGTIIMGWMSDKIFRGRRGPLATVSMFLLAISLSCFYLISNSPWLDTVILLSAGVLVYGPQLLVPVAAADFASKKAASTATGVTGCFGYIGSALAGLGTGLIVDKWGWNGGFIFFTVAAIIGGFIFMLIWNKRSAVLEKYHNDKKMAKVR